MAGLIINYKALDDIVANLNSIAEDETVADLINGLDESFSESNSDTTNALKEIKLKYKEINDVLTSLAINSSAMLEKAKILYQDTDSESANVISEG